VDDVNRVVLEEIPNGCVCLIDAQAVLGTGGTEDAMPTISAPDARAALLCTSAMNPAPTNPARNREEVVVVRLFSMAKQ
jgi:hypothetical protein